MASPVCPLIFKRMTNIEKRFPITVMIGGLAIFSLLAELV
jgi:hypothetical protein